jgi:hypothetical protein
VRPSNLPHNIGEQLSLAIQDMGMIAFDFQSRQAPTKGDFSGWEQPCASCTNLVRLPFEMLGISLPYATTMVSPGAQKNLAKLGLANVREIYTPTNILNDSGFDRIGIIDNGMTAWSIAQAMVVGRPEWPDTFGGYFSQRELVIENLPDWRSLAHWKSAWEAAKLTLGQSNGVLSRIGCAIASFDRNAIPRSASATTIAFYLRSAMESGYIVTHTVVPRIAQLIHRNPDASLHEIRTSHLLLDAIRDSVQQSSLIKEKWYAC